MKKSILAIMMVAFLVLPAFSQENGTEDSEKNEGDVFSLYYVSNEEMTTFIQAWQWLNNWDAGNITVDDDDRFAILYENYVGGNDLISMLWENFFRSTENPEIQKHLKDYIYKNHLENKPYEKALLKKIDSEKKITKDSENNTESTVFVYRNPENDEEEYDENINLFNFYETHPFKDEFGTMVFDNNWQIFNVNSTEEANAPDSKKTFFALCGGNTNSLMMQFQEIEDVETEEDLQAAIDLSFTAEKYGDDWTFMELEKTGVLERCGADNYYIGFGIGPDKFIPEISAGDFVSILYKKDLRKVFIIDTYMNFSTININYEIRNQLYNYLLFYTLFAYCD